MISKHIPRRHTVVTASLVYIIPTCKVFLIFEIRVTVYRLYKTWFKSRVGLKASMFHVILRYIFALLIVSFVIMNLHYIACSKQ